MRPIVYQTSVVWKYQNIYATKINIVVSRWLCNVAMAASVGIDLKELGGSDVEMFELLPMGWNFKPIFTQKWASVDMNWRGSTPQLPLGNSNPELVDWYRPLSVRAHQALLDMMKPSSAWQLLSTLLLRRPPPPCVRLPWRPWRTVDADSLV